jgi:hypothetical protein
VRTAPSLLPQRPSFGEYVALCWKRLNQDAAAWARDKCFTCYGGATSARLGTVSGMARLQFLNLLLRERSLWRTCKIHNVLMRNGSTAHAEPSFDGMLGRGRS